MTADTFELPDWLTDLAAAEPEGALDADRAERQLASCGITALHALGDPARPHGIAWETPNTDGGWIDVLYDKWPTPITTALEELLKAATQIDQLSRLHSALQDMELVSVAARALADEQDSRPEGRISYWLRRRHRLSEVDTVLEVGIVTMYVRSYIEGEANIGGRWRPQSEADRELHTWLIDYRNTVVAHYDRSPHRKLVNITAMNREDGPPVFAEFRTPIPIEKLRALADLCDRQYARFWDATWELKKAVWTGEPPKF